MKLLENYFKKIEEQEEKFRTAPNNPVDFFNYISQYNPELEDMTDEQIEMLVDVLEGIQAYINDYGPIGETKAETSLDVFFNDMFKRYRYRQDPNLDNNNLDPKGEEMYEHLAVNYG